MEILALASLWISPGHILADVADQSKGPLSRNCLPPIIATSTSTCICVYNIYNLPLVDRICFWTFRNFMRPDYWNFKNGTWNNFRVYDIWNMFSKVWRFASVILFVWVFVLNLSCELALLQPFVHKANNVPLLGHLGAIHKLTKTKLPFSLLSF